MDIREQVIKELDVHIDWIQGRKRGEDFDIEPCPYYLTEPFQEKLADQIIPLVRADTLKAISKESKRLDGAIYLVPDYSKFREAIKELGIEVE